MTLQDLKAQAYDALFQIESWQMKLKEINQQIANFKEETIKEETPKTIEK